MKIVYHPGALRDLESIRAYIAEENPLAADKVARRIRSLIDHLESSPYLGRPGPRGVRLLSVAGLPYVVLYRMRHEAVQIVAIFHTARNRRF